MARLIVCLFGILTSLVAISGALEIVSDDELLNLIRTEKYVVVLFSRRSCDKCDTYEIELSNIREDLVDSLNAWVIKVVDSHMTRLYTPDKEPAIVFFRHGVPLLYDGPINDESMFQNLNDNKEPIVKELTDDTFEHLTQVASGATTGDWFIMFYSNDCIDCQRLQARLEAVAAKVKSKVNVARVNRLTTGASTARRFEVYAVPVFILFKQGKMYRYHIQLYDVASFTAFIREWYKNVTPEVVPVPKTPFDDLISKIVVFLKDNPQALYIGLIGGSTFVIGLIVATVSKNAAKKEAVKQKEKPKTKAKAKKDK